MFDTIAGLPIHPLVVHAVEVIVPLAALAVLLAAVWPRFRRWAFGLPLLLALGALVVVPVATQSGEALEERVGETPAVELHTHMGEDLTPWVIGLAVVAVALFYLTWQSRRGGGGGAGAGDSVMSRATAWKAPRWVPAVLMVAALVVSTGTIVQAVRIGHSGATAVWGQTGAGSPAGEGDEDED